MIYKIEVRTYEIIEMFCKFYHPQQRGLVCLDLFSDGLWIGFGLLGDAIASVPQLFFVAQEVAVCFAL